MKKRLWKKSALAVALMVCLAASLALSGCGSEDGTGNGGGSSAEGPDGKSGEPTGIALRSGDSVMTCEWMEFGVRSQQLAGNEDPVGTVLESFKVYAGNQAFLAEQGEEIDQSDVDALIEMQQDNLEWAEEEKVEDLEETKAYFAQIAGSYEKWMEYYLPTYIAPNYALGEKVKKLNGGEALKLDLDTIKVEIADEAFVEKLRTEFTGPEADFSDVEPVFMEWAASRDGKEAAVYSRYLDKYGKKAFVFGGVTLNGKEMECMLTLEREDAEDDQGWIVTDSLTKEASETMKVSQETLLQTQPEENRNGDAYYITDLDLFFEFSDSNWGTMWINQKGEKTTIGGSLMVSGFESRDTDETTIQFNVDVTDPNKLKIESMSTSAVYGDRYAFVLSPERIRQMAETLYQVLPEAAEVMQP